MTDEVNKLTNGLKSARNNHKEEMAEKQRVLEIYGTKLDTLLSDVDDSSGKSSAPSYFVCSITQVSEATHSALQRMCFIFFRNVTQASFGLMVGGSAGGDERPPHRSR